MRRWMIAVVLALAGVMALGAVSFAAAPEAVPAVLSDVAATVGGRLGQGPRGEALREKIVILAETLGMEPRAIARALRDGATVADLAEAQGVPLDDVAEALAAPREARVAGLVEEGLLSEAQAAYLNDRAGERLEDFLTLRPRRAVRQPELERFAAAVGLSEADVVAALAEGQSPAEIVAAQGLTVEGVAAEMVAQLDATLSEKVALDLMSETQKGLAVHRYEQRLLQRLDGTAGFGEGVPGGPGALEGFEP